MGMWTQLYADYTSAVSSAERIHPAVSRHVSYPIRMFRCALIVASVLATAIAASPVAGTWEGKTNDLPSVELTIRDEGGRLNGTIAFYFQTRTDDGKWRLGPKSEGPLLSPKLNGNILTFETTH